MQWQTQQRFHLTYIFHAFSLVQFLEVFYYCSTRDALSVSTLIRFRENLSENTAGKVLVRIRPIVAQVYGTSLLLLTIKAGNQSDILQLFLQFL
jgi:hypothetical protein